MEIANLDFGTFMEIYGGLLSTYNIPQNLLKTLHRKLSNDEFNTGEYFALIADDEKAGKYHSAVTCEEGLESCDEEAIFLVDHAVTYEVNNARQLLENNAGLLNRVANIVGCPDETDVDVVMKQMWKFNQTYSVPSAESPKVRTPLWYILDEFGSAIHHSDEPNVVMIPFYYQPRQMSYSIMWLLSDVEYGDRLVRDFSHNEKDPTLRRCMLLPWIDNDLTKDVDPSPTVVAHETFQRRFEASKETLPEEQRVVEIEKKSEGGGKLKIFFDKYQPGLTDEETFEIVDNLGDADVIWSMDHIKDFEGMSVDHPKKFLNQFPCEQIMVNKDFFAAISMRGQANGGVPPWLPVTFNLQTELPKFVAYYQKQAEKADANNIWICKPWNLARGIQIQVSEDLNEIIRLRETETPQVVSKYIHNPVLYHRSDVNCDVKFTMRCYVILKSVAPLQLFVSKLTRLHFANQQYEKTKFDEYDRHFTVMNYFQDGQHLKEIGLDEFVPNFEKQYSDQKWDDVLDHTHSCIREFFLSATSQQPPFGVGHYNNSRALYAIDILLKWKEDSQGIQPMLLECNFCPDCTQTCQTDANFMNKIFKFCFTQSSADECDMKDISI